MTTTWEVPMSRIAAVLLLVGAVAIVTGIGLMHVPAALIAGGLFAVAGGVLVIELPGRGGDA